MLDFNADSILYETDPIEVEYQACRWAEQLAVLGAIEAASALMSLYYTKGVTGEYRHMFHELAFAWNETGQWPSGCPDEMHSRTFLDGMRERYERSFWGESGGAAVPEKLRTWDEDCLRACLDPEGPYGQAGSERLVKALDISVRLSTRSEDRAESPLRQDVQNVQHDSAEILASNVEQDMRWLSVSLLNARSSKILHQIIARWNQYKAYQMTGLTRAERLWPLYITGVIAQAAGLSRQELDKTAREILDAFTRRFDSPHNGTALTGKSIKELLGVADESTTRGSGAALWFRGMGDLDDEHDTRPKTLFKDPASDDAIAELERRLGAFLPSDYKQFLKISNGFWYGELQKDGRDGIHGLYGPHCGMFDAESVQYDDSEYWNLPLELLKLPREIEELGDVEQQGTVSLKHHTTLAMIDRVLVIGQRDIENLWLIPPEHVEEIRRAYYVMFDRASTEQKLTIERAMEAFAGSRQAFDTLDWICLHWACGGAAEMKAYPSFTRYLETVSADSWASAQGTEEDEIRAEQKRWE